jgi:hypothetical protein
MRSRALSLRIPDLVGGYTVRKQRGFTLVELLVAGAVTLVILAVAVGAAKDAFEAHQRVTLSNDLNDNLRVAMNLIQRDIVLAGEGIPTGGISLPSGPGVIVNRPGPQALAFSQSFLPAITLGTGLGPNVALLDSTTSAARNIAPTDEITLIYTDNTLGLDQAPINLPAGPNVTSPCGGSIDPNGLSLTFDAAPGCVNLASSKFTLSPGDLILVSNINGTALQTVTSVNGQTVYFANDTSIDKFQLNQTGASAGTIVQLQNIVPGSSPSRYDGTYPPMTATRIWMISYYLDDTWDRSPANIRLVKQVNFRPPQPVGEVIEALRFQYNFVDQNTPPNFYANATAIPAGLNENNIRSVNVFLGARSNHGQSPSNNRYLRDNLQTQISVRSLNFYNKYQ